MKKRFFRSIFTIALTCLLLLGGCVFFLLYQKSLADGWATLEADAAYMAPALEAGGTGYLSSVRSYPGRITLIRPDGTVLYDDREAPAAMENHAARPEVASALQQGVGRALRQSSTLGRHTLYYALRLQGGQVLRLSVETADISAQLLSFLPWLAGIIVLLLIVSALTARWQARRILAPLNTLDLDSPLDADAYEELSPLLRKIAAQKEQITAQITRGEARQAEFSSITKNMDEGLIVTGRAGTVLTINQSACRFLGITEMPADPVPLLQLSRNLRLEEASRQAAAGHRVEDILELGGRQFRLVASPVAAAGSMAAGPPPDEEGPGGAVLLLMDDTEKLLAEQARREFSANVSHELKTPLTSISGYAEIIHSGLVKAEDIAGFAGKIHDESARMIALVNDIIKLSRLDEKQAPAPKEPVELLRLARQTAQNLETPAEEKGIELSVTGQPVTVFGVPSILLEIIYNLLENGIRYTPAGGQVHAFVGEEEGEAILRVSDTGIGIPPEHQPHIFERFYRVDKSHSRESGGTGLGLSIVKRGALYHNGRLELHSEPGRGSTFTVRLPLRQLP